MLRHLARPGHQRRRLHGGGRGRPAEEVRLPEVLCHGRRRHGRHRGHARRADPAVPELPAGAVGPGRRRPPAGPPGHAQRHSRRGRCRPPAATVADTTTPAPRTKFAYPPNLVVVDGGKPQVNAAARALAELGIDDVYVVGLAKRLEEVWLPDSDFPVILPRASAGLYLLQRIRDEAHRFAISFHRQKRGKAMTVSALDGVPAWANPSARPCSPSSARSRASGRPVSRNSPAPRGSARPSPRRSSGTSPTTRRGHRPRDQHDHRRNP